MKETKRHVALEDMYAVVNKKQKKKQNEDTPPVPVFQYSQPLKGTTTLQL